MRILLAALTLSFFATADDGEKRINFLLERLEHAKDFKLRVAAAQELGKIADGSVAEWMTNSFKKEKNPAVRLSTLMAIAQIPDERILPPLAYLTQEVALSEAEHLTVERTLWTYRACIHLSDWEAVMLKSKEPADRRLSAWILGLSGESRVLPSLKRAAQDPSPIVRQAAFRAVGILGRPAEKSFCISAAKNEKHASVKKSAEACAEWIDWANSRRIPEAKNPLLSLNRQLQGVRPHGFSYSSYAGYAKRMRPPQPGGDVEYEIVDSTANRPVRESIPLLDQDEKRPTLKMSAEVMESMGYYAQDVAVLKEALRGRAADIDGCYKKRLEENEKLRGDLHIAVTVVGDGKVKDVAFSKNSLTDEKLRSCVKNIIHTTPFPETGFKSVTVQYQFTFFPPVDQKLTF